MLNKFIWIGQGQGVTIFKRNKQFINNLWTSLLRTLHFLAVIAEEFNVMKIKNLLVLVS